MELQLVEESVAETGIWESREEWRVMTWIDIKISQETLNGKPRFMVSVRCDNQAFCCQCPSLLKAFVYSKLYCHLIVYQFYSIGPPWA